MTDEQRKSVALEYLKAFDNKGVTSSGGSILDLFADDAQVFFPKWGLANGKAQIGQLFTDFGGGIRIAGSFAAMRVITALWSGLPGRMAFFPRAASRKSSLSPACRADSSRTRTTLRTGATPRAGPL